MYRKLSQIQQVSFTTLKFTRFIIGSNLLFVLGMLLMTVVVPSFMMRQWDITGVFIAIAKNEGMDILALSCCSLIAYMLYNKKCYESMFKSSTPYEEIPDQSSPLSYDNNSNSNNNNNNYFYYQTNKSYSNSDSDEDNSTLESETL
jgi:hypothetical protein